MLKKRHYIREWRKYRKLTQEQLAERIGVDRTYVSKIETGKKRYDQFFLEAVATELNCDVADLISRDPHLPLPLWRIIETIPEPEQERATRAAEAVLKTFARTGTDG